MVGGGGFNGYGFPRAWGGGGNAFWNFRRQKKVKIWKPSVVGYGYFSGIAQSMCQLTQYRSICYLICCKRV